MSSTNSETLAKMRALREAQKLGCSGAHKTDDGFWHPCSSAEALQSLEPKRFVKPTPLVVQPKRNRTRVGSANIQKQWERLGSRGVVAIDTLSGGGLVSGVVGKALLAGSPLDEDPDVFTNIEAARNRSRQLGCIGVSRRTSRSGRTVWMPCTNMTDLANRTGRTFLGRRNMQRRAQRFISDEMKRRQRLSRRPVIRKKSLLEEIHGIGPKLNVPYRVKSYNPQEVKRLGPNIGRGLRSAPTGFTFVDITGAIDADKDGIVFEGKPLERPIIPKFTLPDGIARRVQKLIQGTAEENEQKRRQSPLAGGEIDSSQLAAIIGVQAEQIDGETVDPLLQSLRKLASETSSRSKRKIRASDTSPEKRIPESIDLLPPVDAGQEFSKKAKRAGKSRALKNIERISEVDGDYSDYTIGELTDLTRESIPTSPEQLTQLLKTNPYTRNNWKRVLSRIEDAGIDWEAQKLLADHLVADIERSPLMQAMIREYGLPPIVATNFKPDIESLGFLNATLGPSAWLDTIGGWSGAGFIGLNSKVITNSVDGTRRPNTFSQYVAIDEAELMRHELAHAWETMAARKGGPARDHYIAQYQEMAEGLFKIVEDGKDNFSTSYHDAPWGTEAEHRSALKISEYAETARIEWFAESVMMLTSGDPRKVSKVDSLSIQNIAAVLGKTPFEIASMNAGFFDESLGFEISSRSSRTPINSLFGKPDKKLKEALDFVDKNPEWFDDLPDDMLVRLEPKQLESRLSSLGSSLSSMRSYRKSDIERAGKKAEEARKSGELGQSIIDLLFNKATGKNASAEQPTLWFIGGTTGSGKTTLRNMGALEGVPSPDVAVDIDPDVIKSMHPDWDGGLGAQKIHGWSTQWSRYGLRQSMAQQRDTVITGTGVRTDQLSGAKDNGYLTVGHFVYVPSSIAERNMNKRSQSGGTNLPTWFAQRYSAELSDKIPRAITSGHLDEFFLWDNSGSKPKLAVRRTRDGKYEIFDRTTFEAFLGKRGAKYVEDYWKSEADGTKTSLSSRSTRLVPKRPEITKSTEVSEIVGKSLNHSRVIGYEVPENFDISDYDWFGSEFKSVTANGRVFARPVQMEETRLDSVSMSKSVFPPGSSFAFAKLTSVDFSESTLDRSDFSNTVLSNANFTGAILGSSSFRGAIIKSADFSGVDLSGTDLSPDEIDGSGLIWDAKTKFPPSVAAFISGQKISRRNDGRFTLQNRALTTSAFSLSSEKYGITAQPKRTTLAGVPDGPRRELHRNRTMGSDGLSIDGKEVRDFDSSQMIIDRLDIDSSILSSGRMIGSDARNARIANSKLESIDGERLNLSGSTVISSQIVNSNLYGADFRRSTIVGRVSFAGSDMRRAKMSGLKFGRDGINGSLDLRGADVRGADFTNVDISRIKSDGFTRWDGALFPHMREVNLPVGMRGLVVSARSQRFDSDIDARLSIDRLNDYSMDVGKFARSADIPNSREAIEARKDISGIYRSLVNAQEELDDIDSGIDIFGARGDSYEKQLNALSSIPMKQNETIDLYSMVKNERRDAFNEGMQRIRSESPSMFGNKNTSEVYREIAALISAKEFSDFNIDSLRSEKEERRQILKNTGLIASLANMEVSPRDEARKVSSSLPKGKRQGPLELESSRSVRGEIPVMSPEYVDSMMDEDNFDVFFDSLLESAEEREVFRGRLAELAYDYKTQIDEIGEGKYNDLVSHPLAGLTVGDAIERGRIVIYEDGTHSLVMPPNGVLTQFHPVQRNYSSVELPSLEKVEAALSRLDSPSKSSVFTSDGNKIIANKVARDIIESIEKKLSSIEAIQTDKKRPFTSSSFIGQYLHLLHNPHSVVDGPYSQRPLLALHDDFGHNAIGRGFDRHGEWAVMLSTLSFVRDGMPEISPEEKQAFARELLATFGIWALARANKMDFENISKWEDMVHRYQGDIFEVIDILDPRDGASSISMSARSMRRPKKPILSPQELNELNKIEAKDRLARMIIEHRQLKERKRNATRRPESPRKKTPTPTSPGTEADTSQASARSQISSRSSKSTPTERPRIDWRLPGDIKGPGHGSTFSLDDDGNLKVVRPSGSKSPIDITAITEDDIPASFNPRQPGAMRLLGFRREVERWNQRNLTRVSENGTLDAMDLLLWEDRDITPPQAIFRQDVVKSLSDGEVIIVKDIPGDLSTTSTKAAVAVKVGPDTVVIELEDWELQKLEQHISQIKSLGAKGAGENTGVNPGLDGLEVFSVAQLSQLLNGGQTGADTIARRISDYQRLTKDVDTRYERPYVMIKKDSYIGSINLPEEEIEKYGGVEAAKAKVQGTAYRAGSTVVMYNSGTKGFDPTTTAHEFAHIMDVQATGFGLISESNDWADAISKDRETGQGLIKNDKTLQLAISEQRIKMPLSYKQTPYNSPIVGRDGVSPYGSTMSVEDFAEAVKMFLVDMEVGHLIEETELDGKIKKDGKKWTFAELYPERAKLIEDILFREKKRREARSLSSASRREQSFEDRFSSKYATNAPEGDGDCFVSAINSVEKVISDAKVEEDSIRVVHGIPLGTGGEAEGLRFPHAWVEVYPFDITEYEELKTEKEQLLREIARQVDVNEKNQIVRRLNTLQELIFDKEMQILVYDSSNGNNVVVPRAFYYGIGNISSDDSRYYLVKQAKELMDELGHYGPWE